MDSGIQYRQLIQSLHQHQGEMQKKIIEQEEEHLVIVEEVIKK